MNDFLHQSTHHTLYQALQWVQNSPPLFNQRANPLCLNQPLPDDTPPFLPDTEQLNQLASLLSQKGNPLLGIFYETLWQFLLNKLPDCQLLANNLQVQHLIDDQKQTLGEYDLIYRHNQQVIHRELAVKFYLGIPCPDSQKNGSSWQQWVGPGLKDRLDRKIDRLIQHQIKLGDTDEGQQALIKLGINLPVKREVLVQGRLFYPLYCPDTAEAPIINLAERLQKPPTSTMENNTALMCQPPEYSNPSHLRGFWLTVSQFLLCFEPTSEDFIYQIPKKTQWLNQQSDSRYLDHTILLSQLGQQSHPIYVIATHRELQVLLHLFIVPDDWPQRAKAVSETKI